MRCPTLSELPPSPPGKTGWPWTEESEQLPDVMPNGHPWPRVSIVTPSLNQGRYLEESIRSVLLQGYPDLEYIIIDGGSADNSVEVIRKYEPWLAYWVSQPDRGQSHAINKGLARSRGRFFNWQNADDVLTPGSLAVTAAALASHPEASLVFGYYKAIDDRSNSLRGYYRPRFHETGLVQSLVWSVGHLSLDVQPGCLMDRALVLEVGGVDEDLHYAMDISLNWKLCLMRPSFFVDFPVVCFRVHSASKSVSVSSSHLRRRAQESLYLVRTFFERDDLPPEIKRLKGAAFRVAHRTACAHYYKAKDYRRAWWDGWAAVVHSPSEGWYIMRIILSPVKQALLGTFRNLAN